MKYFQKKPYIKLLSLLSKRRRRQTYFLIFLLVLNGLLESFSIASILPFLSLIASRNEISQIPIISSYAKFLGIYDSSSLFLFFTIIFSTFIISSTFLRIFNNAFIARLSAKINIDISSMIYKNNMYQSYSQYTKNNSSKIISLALEKVEIGSSAIYSLLSIISSSILSISIIISLLIINWRILSIAFTFILIFYLLIYGNIKKILSKNGEITAEFIPLRLRLLKESLEGFRDVIINNLEKVYIDLFNEYNSTIKLKRANSEILITVPRLLMEGIVLTSLTLIAYFLFSSNYNLVNLLPYIGAFIYAFQKLLPLIQQIYSALANYRYKVAVINDLVFDLDNGKENENLFFSKKIIKFQRSIVFKNIYFNFDNSETILKDVNLTIKKGELIGIYGQTGSGKSTLLDLLMGLIAPKKGRVLIDNNNVFSINSSSIWTSNIAHVPQNIFLKEGTIEENIAFGEKTSNIDLGLLIKASKIAQIYEFINDTNNGFKTLVGERGILLSGGQKQRIAIARAIYKSKSLLVLDEATSALDNRTEEKIINSISKMDKKLTIIMVTHRLNTLKCCDRIFKVINKSVIEEKR